MFINTRTGQGADEISGKFIERLLTFLWRDGAGNFWFHPTFMALKM